MQKGYLIYDKESTAVKLKLRFNNKAGNLHISGRIDDFRLAMLIIETFHRIRVAQRNQFQFIAALTALLITLLEMTPAQIVVCSQATEIIPFIKIIANSICKQGPPAGLVLNETAKIYSACGGRRGTFKYN